MPKREEYLVEWEDQAAEATWCDRVRHLNAKQTGPVTRGMKVDATWPEDGAAYPGTVIAVRMVEDED